MNLNRTLIAGLLTTEPKLRETGSGTPVCNFCILHQHNWEDMFGDKKVDPCSIEVTVYGRGAANAAKYLKKNDPVFIDGRLRLDSWVHDGERKTAHKIIAQSVIFLGHSTKEVVSCQE